MPNKTATVPPTASAYAAAPVSAPSALDAVPEGTPAVATEFPTPQAVPVVDQPQTGGSYSRDPVTGALTRVEEVRPAPAVLRHDALGEPVPSLDLDAAIPIAPATQQKAD
jgi:hypothetical protein